MVNNSESSSERKFSRRQFNKGAIEIGIGGAAMLAGVVGSNDHPEKAITPEQSRQNLAYRIREIEE